VQAALESIMHLPYEDWGDILEEEMNRILAEPWSRAVWLDVVERLETNAAAIRELTERSLDELENAA
jgi:hypothetical protein